MDYISALKISTDSNLRCRESDREIDVLIENYQREKNQICEQLIPLSRKMYSIYCADLKWL